MKSNARNSHAGHALGGVAVAGGRHTGDRPDRDGKGIIGGHFTQDTKFAVQELLIRMGRTAGARVTVQDAIGMGLERIFREYDVEPPEELLRLRKPIRPKTGEPAKRKLATADAD